MSLHTAIKKIREKPQRVRERILAAVLIVVTPALFTLWYFSFASDSKEVAAASLKDLGATAVSSLNNPIYDQAFGDPSITAPVTPDDGTNAANASTATNANIAPADGTQSNTGTTGTINDGTSMVDPQDNTDTASQTDQTADQNAPDSQNLTFPMP